MKYMTFVYINTISERLFLQVSVPWAVLWELLNVVVQIRLAEIVACSSMSLPCDECGEQSDLLVLELLSPV